MNERIQYPGSLHNHTDYSNLRLRDSINTYNELIDYSISLGQEVIAFTEHESISNAVKIEKYYKKIKEKHPDFKVILGNEIYLCRNDLQADNFVKGQDSYYHFILLAKDLEGHKQIRQLSTRAWLRSYKTNNMIRVPTYYRDLVEIVGANPGHLIASTACLGGQLPKMILSYLNNEQIYTEQYIHSWCTQMQQLFGKDNFYLEMQPSNNKEQIQVNKYLYNLSLLLDIPFIITNDAHYLKKEEAPIHKAFLNAQDGEREVDDFYATTYLMNTEELESYFTNYFSTDILHWAYENILKIKAQCEDYSLLKPLKIPELQWRPVNKATLNEITQYCQYMPTLSKFYNSIYKSDRYLVDAVIDGIKYHTDLQNQQAYNELEDNLQRTWESSEVNKARWSAYFLNLQNTIDECWNAGTIVMPARGSGGGFLLLYCLDIIQLNSLRETTKCYPWRFLNPKRESVLDIDTDISGAKRSQVLRHLRKVYGEDRVCNVVTFGTEKSKSAIQTAARGLGIDVDDAAYLSSLIPSDRGQLRTLHQCYYGDEEKGFDIIHSFKREMSLNFPELWRVAQKIEGLVCRVGEHAGGVIFVDEDFTESTALMRAPNGDIMTQFDLHDAEDVSLIKIDLLSVEAADKIQVCIDLLCDYGYAERKSTLRETYESIIGLYNLERNDPKMWDMVRNHQVQSLFQMEQQSGIQGIALTNPRSVDELAVLNSVIRLMASEPGAEQPLNMWAKYRKNINIWYNEMVDYGLAPDDIQWLMHNDAITDGVCEAQEGLMSLLQDDKLGGNDLSFADKCRKAIAKKQGKLFEECEETYFKNAEEKNCDMRLVHYVWDVLLKVQRGYSFCRAHTLAYSLVALQEMNLAYKYPIIFWNTACLIVNSGSLEDNSSEEIVNILEPENEEILNGTTYIDLPDRSGKIKKTASTDYAKLAKAIGDTQKLGIKISLTNINKSSYSFKPDVENNQILFGLKGMLGLGDDIIQTIINNRPYTSPRDFLNKVKPTRSVMISLIKGGAFDEMMDRKLCMAWYLWETCDKKSRLTLQNLNGLMTRNMLPEDTEERIMARRVYEFNRYLKSVCMTANKAYYILDDRAISFLQELNADYIVQAEANILYCTPKEWDKVYQSWMDVFRTWINSDKENILNELNKQIFLEDWNKYALGTISSWEMETLCFYYHEHELQYVNRAKYGILNFNQIPEHPVIERTFVKGNKEINIYQLYKICGTCIAKNKNKSSVSLLTTDGVVEIKFNKEHFSMFDKQISQKDEKGTKHVIERSWFNRGSMIIVQGMRDGDVFRAKKYASSGGHQLYKIDTIYPDGDIEVRTQRIDISE